MQESIWLLWALATVSAAVMSVGFAITSISGSAAASMLPLGLHPNSPPSLASRLMLSMMLVAFLSFYGSLLALLLVGPWVFAVLGGVALFFAKFAAKGWWTRRRECRPMKPFLLFSVAMIALLVSGGFSLM